MTREEFLERIRREPFEPFRVVHTSGATADVFMPRCALVMVTHVAIFQRDPNWADRVVHQHVDWRYADIVEAIERDRVNAPIELTGATASGH